MKREETFYTSFNPIPSVEPPKAAEAPPELQLQLPPDQSFTPLSRPSTTLSATKVNIDIQSTRDNRPIQFSSRKESAKTPVERKPKGRVVISRGANRKHSTKMSVKTLKNAGSYVKNANALKGVKLNSKTFKQNVKLIGKVRKMKKVKSKPDSVPKQKENKDKVETKITITDVDKASKQQMLHDNLIKPPVVAELTEVSVDVEDTNFFMCSNEVDTIPIKTTDKGIAKSADNVQNHQPESPLVVKPMPAKHHKFVLPKFKNIQPPTFNFSAIVDKAKKVSKIRTNKLIDKKKSDSQSEPYTAAMENTAVRNLVDSLKRKGNNRKRRRKKPEMPALTRYARIPTLINWVEYSDLLHTPSMQMQSRLNTSDAQNKENTL